jgi:pyruvate dehydrogenase E1 component beta subunit
MARDERGAPGEDIACRGVQDDGLAERFEEARAQSPISETAIAGAAMGAAMAGLRPVAEIMFSDFYGVCWDRWPSRSRPAT